MSYRKHRVALPGLLVLAALGAMAFASSAQAVEPSFAIKGAKALHASVTGEKDSTVGSSLDLLLVSKLNLEIKCPKFKVISGLILTALDADVTLLYEECKSFAISNLEELPCHVSDAPLNPTKLHITVSALLLPIEFASGDYGILVERIATTISFLEGTGCPLPLKNKISGEVCFLITPATNDTTVPLIESSQAIQESCPPRKVLEGLEKINEVGATNKDKILYGTNEAFFDAKAKLSLTGEHAGLTLGVLLL